MTVNSESVILDALLTKIGTLEQSWGVPVAYPNVPFTAPTENAGNGTTRALPYVFVNVINNTSALEGISFDEPVEQVGLLALNVVWPAGQGLVKPLQLAGKIVNSFKPGTVLVQGGVEIKFYEQPRVAPEDQDNDRVTIPVSVRWKATTPPNG